MLQWPASPVVSRRILIEDANGLIIAAMSGHTWGGYCDIVPL
jgi:hypothetical protein